MAIIQTSSQQPVIPRAIYRDNFWGIIMLTNKKRCGNCKYWTGEDYYGTRECQWPVPKLPFWATGVSVSDHGDYTEAEDGTRCATWVEKIDGSGS
jgi:hypothetical protein